MTSASEINKTAEVCTNFISSMKRLELMQKLAKKERWVPFKDRRVILLFGVDSKLLRKNVTKRK